MCLNLFTFAEMQLNQILQHVQVLVNTQNLDELQMFLNELNTFLLNLKIILDTAFTSSNLESHEESHFVQFVKPLSAIYGIKNKVVLALTNHEEIEIKEDLPNVKVEAEEYDYNVNEYKEITETVKHEVEVNDYTDIGPDYNENDDIGNQEVTEDNQEGV